MFAILKLTCILSTWTVPSNNEIWNDPVIMQTCLRADVSYFLCCTPRATKEIGDVCTQAKCKRDTKQKSHPGMKLAPVRVFSCKHPQRCSSIITKDHPLTFTKSKHENYQKHSIKYKGVLIWNKLPNLTFNSFRKKLRTHFLHKQEN